jgi:hypothetical protein
MVADISIARILHNIGTEKDDLYVNGGQRVLVGQGKYLNMPTGKNKLMRPLVVI